MKPIYPMFRKVALVMPGDDILS